MCGERKMATKSDKNGDCSLIMNSNTDVDCIDPCKMCGQFSTKNKLSRNAKNNDTPRYSHVLRDNYVLVVLLSCLVISNLYLNVKVMNIENSLDRKEIILDMDLDEAIFEEESAEVIGTFGIEFSETYPDSPVELYRDSGYTKVPLLQPNRVKRETGRSKSKETPIRHNKKKKEKKRKSRNTKSTPMLAIHLDSGSNTNCLDGMFRDWKPDSSVNSKGYLYSEGTVTVDQSGIYFIYSQVTYVTKFPLVSFSVNKITAKSAEGDPPIPIMKCINSVEMSSNEDDSENASGRHKQCYVGKAVYLNKNDKIFLKEELAEDYKREHGVPLQSQVAFQIELTYWGMFKIA